MLVVAGGKRQLTFGKGSKTSRAGKLHRASSARRETILLIRTVITIDVTFVLVIVEKARAVVDAVESRLVPLCHISASILIDLFELYLQLCLTGIRARLRVW
jgi:hypothetical protein